jgi:chromosome segregation ATPase
MAPGSTRRRRRSDSQDPDDSDEGDSQARDSPKRQRLSSASASDNDDHDDALPAGINGQRNGISSSDFQPGAIVRVSVENFVTYEKADFFPGPHLNMVIGPNGTGKSSLVCAICLGLGYSPKHLGRAGSVKEFVKHGKDTASIEIELQKRRSDSSNWVIRVLIRREQNSQKWWLNAKETTHKTIQKLMRKLKIQVDNLCQFLPQDRVVEFAACTPVDLLHETLRAAAPEEMLNWQARLRELHNDKKSLAEAAQTDKDTLQNLESRQQGLQADVDRIREREEIQQQVRCLEYALVVARYQETRKQYAEAKERKKAAERSLRNLEEESGPSLQAVNAKQDYVRQIEMAVAGREAALKDLENTAKRLTKDIDTATESFKELENNAAAERKGFEAKKKDLAASRLKITTYQGDLRNRPEDFSASDWNQKIVRRPAAQPELDRANTLNQ